MPYGSVMLSHAEYTVEEEGQVQFAVLFVGPSSTQSTAPAFVQLVPVARLDPSTT